MVQSSTITMLLLLMLLGTTSAFLGQRSWHPLAVASRSTISDYTVVEDDNGDDVAAPHRSVTVAVTQGNSIPEEDDTVSSPRRRRPLRRGRPALEGASWMQRNKAFTNDEEKTDNSSNNNNNNHSQRTNDRRRPPPASRHTDQQQQQLPSSAKTFRQDFRGTRVFVQNLPLDASWQDLKDHFRLAGDVVFASVSVDRETGQSKGTGIVQFQNTEMAATAIAIMRNHPLQGNQLYVRPDVQETSTGPNNNNKPLKKGPTPPTKWKCANEDNAQAALPDNDRKAVIALIKARDDARRRRQYQASDTMRDELKHRYGVFVDDRLHLWWTAVDGHQKPPPAIYDANGDGRWGAHKPAAWRQIPTTPEHDACVSPDLVEGLLAQRDIARREKDFATADALLEQARTAPDGDLCLRIHDESRTWRIWTDEPPPTTAVPRRTPSEQCLDIIREHAPQKYQEMETILDKFPGREYNILKKLKQRYLQQTTDY